MSKFEKAKGWIKEHGEEIAVIGLYAATFAAVTGLAVWAYKQEVKTEEEENNRERAMQEKVVAAIARGDSVLPGGPDGYWIIPNANRSVN